MPKKRIACADNSLSIAYEVDVILISPIFRALVALIVIWFSLDVATRLSVGFE